MHLKRFVIYQGVFITLMLLEIYSQKLTNIGIVNKKWMDILNPKLASRNWMSKCKLFEIQLPPNISFYESIISANDIISQFKLDVIIGDSRLDVAQAAAFQTIPFIAFDNKLHVKTRPEYDSMPHYYSLPVSERIYALATFDILEFYKITQVAIIIDNSVDYQNFIKPFFEVKLLFSKVWTIPFHSSENQNQKETLIDAILQEIKHYSYLDIIVKANKDNLNLVMAKARYHGIISNPFRWFILGFVCENFNIKSLKHIYTNFTLINEVCTERSFLETQNFRENSLINQFIQIIRLVKWDFSPKNLKTNLQNNIRSLLSFDDKGNRNSYTLVYNTISRLPNKTLSLIGSWQKKIGVPRIFHLKVFEDDIQNTDSSIPKFLKIISLEEHPHLIVKEDNNYIGFGVDLISKLSEILNFNYSINIVVSDGGSKSKWDKLLSELIEGKADISLGPVVQTKEREENLDFSTSFKQREISLVMKRPSSSPSFFQFLGPFSTNIWLCFMSSIVILTALLWILEHFHRKYFPENGRVKFDLKESSWFIIASTLQGGTEHVPYSIPGRILTASLYFFVLIIVSTYTANLAAFLTFKAYTNPIDSVDDLVNLPPESKIKFGTVKNSAIFDFFYHSEIEAYQKIYKLMTVINKDWLVNNSTEGYLRAMNENYVFIWDDSVNQYEIFTDQEYKCQLYIVGLPFGKRSFAVGMPQGSTYKEKINSAILHLLESGVIENLEHKWWKSTSICSGPAPTDASGSLTVMDLAGVFLILLCGVIISIISLIIEIIVIRCKPIDAIRNCWSQFFSHLPSTADPPIVPPPRNTIDHSRHSTTISSMRSDQPRSMVSDELQHLFKQTPKFDFQQTDSYSPTLVTPT